MAGAEGIRVLGIAEDRDAEFFRQATNAATTTIVSPGGAAVENPAGSSATASVVSRSGGLACLRRSLLAAETGKGPVRVLATLARQSSLGCYLRQKHSSAHFQRLVTFAEKHLQGVCVVLADSDRGIDLAAAVLAVAHRMGIRIVMPYVGISAKNGVIGIRRIVGGFRWWNKPSLYRLYGAVRLRALMREGYFYQEPSLLFALRAHGMLSGDPWEMGMGSSDIVCVDNVSTYRRYRANGVAEEKLRIVGDVAYDTLFQSYQGRQALRQMLVARGVLRPARPVLVLAMPQLGEQGTVAWGQHWQEVRSLMAQLGQTGCNLVISLHPRANRQDYQFLERDYGAYLAPQPLSEILPMADLFVAANSSTLVWAVLCGVPSLVLDYLGLDSSIFNHLHSLRFVPTRDGVAEAVREALEAPHRGLAEDWEALSREAVFDGHVLDRYRALLFP